MSTGSIRKELIQIVETGDEALVKMLYEAASNYNSEDDIEVTEEELVELERRAARVKNAEAKLFTWEEAKVLISGKNEI